LSGISGIVRFDGVAPAECDVQRMTRAMAHRGPNGRHHCVSGPVAFGHCLMRTTEEAADERQPIASDDGALVLVADATLANAPELRRLVVAAGARLSGRSDSELILRAYEVFGPERFLEYIDGDFAIAVWDRHLRRLLCARDRIGMRPFHWHQSARLGFCFASDPESILALPDMTCSLNEIRIADSLVGGLEAYDLTSTLYDGISRLPPAHVLICSHERLHIRRFWTFNPPNIQRLKCSEDYQATYRDALSTTVRRRLRGTSTLGAMLSGGLDSSSVAAVARRLLQEAGAPPLPTFSAIGPDPAQCLESRTIKTAATMSGIDPHFVDFADLELMMSDLMPLTLGPPTPFDCNMTLVRAVYLTAHRAGMRAIFDGVGGDVALGSGGAMVHLLRRGRVWQAVRHARGSNVVAPSLPAVLGRVVSAARQTVTPFWARRLKSRLVPAQPATDPRVTFYLCRPDLAARAGVTDRWQESRRARLSALSPGEPELRAKIVFKNENIVARERYEREAARLQIEPRDPFFDIAFLTFCLSVPLEAITHDGWPKVLARKALAGELPEAVLWRRGRSHLGADFTRTVLAAAAGQNLLTTDDFDRLSPYVDLSRLRSLLSELRDGRPLSDSHRINVLRAIALARWLARQKLHAAIQ